MDKLFKYLGLIATIITIVAGCVAIYFAFNEKRIKLDVQTTYAENLTTHKTIQDLSVKYYYCDSLEVHNLWKMQWVIRNIGDKTIVGHGNNSQLLLNTGLPIQFASDSQILSLEISSSNNDAILQNKNISFKQWRRGEYVEITAFIESVNQPDIKLSNRDVIDSEISYSKFSPDIANQYNSIAEYLPRWLNKTFKIIYYFLASFTFIAILLTLFGKGNDISTKIAVIILLSFMLIPLLWVITI